MLLGNSAGPYTQGQPLQPSQPLHTGHAQHRWYNAAAGCESAAAHIYSYSTLNTRLHFAAQVNVVAPAAAQPASCTTMHQ
jgi:hypothetical protein